MSQGLARAAVGLALAFVLASHDAAAQERRAPPPVSVERGGADRHWVQGQVTVSAPPDVVWSRLQAVHEWPRLFTDLKELEVKQRRPSGWEIALETHTLPGGVLDYHLDFEPAAKRLRVWRTGSGAAVQAFALVRDGPTKNETNVVYSLYIRLSGPPKLFISDKSLREKQTHIVTQTLTDLHRAFGGAS